MINFENRIFDNVHFMRLLFIILILILSCLDSKAQSFQFAKKYGSSSFSIDEKYDLKEKDGYLYSVGVFIGIADFDPTANSQTFSAYNSLGNVFMTKYDSLGNYLWAKRFGFGSYLEVKTFAIDDSSNIYIVGDFGSTADFDPSANSFNLTAQVASSLSNHDIFIAKYDSSGQFNWAKRIGGIGHETGDRIVLDDSSNIYISGNFDNTVDFDPSSNTFFLNTNGSNGSNVYIAKYSPQGNFVWAKRSPGPSAVNIRNVLLEYNYAKNTLVQSYAKGGQYLIQYDTDGNIIWNKYFAINSTVYYNGIATDNSGGIYFCGQFIGTIDFDPDSTINNLTSVTSNWDIFLSKLDWNGNFILAKSMGGNSYDAALSIAVDKLKNIYTTGMYSNSADFDPGPGTRIINRANVTNQFISQLDSNGNYIYASSLNGNDKSKGHDLVIDDQLNIYAIGAFKGSTDFDPTAAIYNMTSSGSFDNTYLLKLGNRVTKIEDKNYEVEISIYPNPVFHSFNIEIPELLSTNCMYKIYNSTGQTVKEGVLDNGTNSIKFDVKKGYYILELMNQDFKVTKSLIKQ